MKWWLFQPSWANGTAEQSRLSPDSDLFKSAVSVFEAFKSGNTNINYEQGSGNGSDQAAAAGSDTKLDKEIPF